MVTAHLWITCLLFSAYMGTCRDFVKAPPPKKLQASGFFPSLLNYHQNYCTVILTQQFKSQVNIFFVWHYHCNLCLSEWMVEDELERWFVDKDWMKDNRRCHRQTGFGAKDCPKIFEAHTAKNHSRFNTAALSGSSSKIKCKRKS